MKSYTRRVVEERIELAEHRRLREARELLLEVHEMLEQARLAGSRALLANLTYIDVRIADRVVAEVSAVLARLSEAQERLMQLEDRLIEERKGIQ